MSDRNPVESSDGRRAFLGLSLLGAAGGAVVPLAATPADAAEQGDEPRNRALFPAGAPAAASGYSPGVAARGSRVVFVSGQGPSDMKADMETQLRQTMDRIALVLKEGGASFRDVVMIRAYFVNIARDLPIYRKVRKDYLHEPFPASSAVGVSALAVPELEIEIEAVAIV